MDGSDRDGTGETTGTATGTWSRMMRGDQNSTWFFVGATFAFVAAGWSFTGKLHLLGGLLLAFGALLIAVGIYVWQRPIAREQRDERGIDPAAEADPSGHAPPPRI